MDKVNVRTPPSRTTQLVGWDGEVARRLAQGEA